MKKDKKKIVESSADGTRVEITPIEGTKLAVWKKIQ